MEKLITKKKNLIQYRFEILFLFVLLEVLLYDKLSIAQAIVSIIEFIFLLVCVLINKRVGVMYLLSFTLLSLGTWSYVTQEDLPYNFWGIRLFGFSFNVLFTISISIYLLAVNRFRIKKIEFSSMNLFFIRFIVYSIIVGLIFVFFFGENFIDNFLKDLLVYFPYFFYLYLLSFLELDDVLLIIKYGIAFSIITMLLSFFTRIFFDYGDGFSFALMNSFTFISVFTLFFFRKLYTQKEIYFLFFSLLFLLFSGRVFIGSKSFILIIVLFLWIAFSSLKYIKYFFLCLVLLFIFLNPIITWVSTNINSDLVVSYKFSQIFGIFELVDVETIAQSKTSMGNVVAEGVTIFRYMMNHPLFFLFGKGFGGGITDANGYLAIYVGDGAGYGDIDLLRNQFTRMHLPFFEIIIKTGFLGMFFYLKLLYQSFRKKDIFSFSLFIVIMTVFSNSKEMLLLCMLFDYGSFRLNSVESNFNDSFQSAALTI